MSKRYPRELKERAVRMVLECEKDYETRYGAVKAVANRLDIGIESLRVWVKNADPQASEPARVAPVKSEREKELEREVRELRRANEILKAAASFFARELDPPQR